MRVFKAKSPLISAAIIARSEESAKSVARWARGINPKKFKGLRYVKEIDFLRLSECDYMITEPKIQWLYD